MFWFTNTWHSGVLINWLGGAVGAETSICSVCWFPWCKNDQFQATNSSAIESKNVRIFNNWFLEAGRSCSHRIRRRQPAIGRMALASESLSRKLLQTDYQPFSVISIHTSAWLNENQLQRDFYGVFFSCSLSLMACLQSRKMDSNLLFHCVDRQDLPEVLKGRPVCLPFLPPGSSLASSDGQHSTCSRAWALPLTCTLPQGAGAIRIWTHRSGQEARWFLPHWGHEAHCGIVIKQGVTTPDDTPCTLRFPSEEASTPMH